MSTGHGHVVPREDGAKARCGGPALCDACRIEYFNVHGELWKPDHLPPERPNLANIGPGGNLNLEHIFSYHAPHDDQVSRYTTIRAMGFHLATVIAENCPSSPERSTAIAKVREAVMWANAAIACNEKENPDA